jgi:hypothetical protein
MLMGGFWAVREGRELHFTFLICSYSLLRFFFVFRSIPSKALLFVLGSDNH